jgi:hypothetical protein
VHGVIMKVKKKRENVRDWWVDATVKRGKRRRVTRTMKGIKVRENVHEHNTIEGTIHERITQVGN